MELHELIPGLVIAAVGCCGFGAIRVVRHRSGGVRLVGRIAGGAAVLISIGALSMYGCAMSLTYRSPALVSPDGSHQARITEFDGGAADSFHTRVMIREKWHVYPKEAFYSNDTPQDIRIEWASNNRLVVRYPSERPARHENVSCAGSVQGIQVVCEPY